MDDQRIGRVILALRQRRGWRQEDLAVRSGVSQSAISDMERGRIDRYTMHTTRSVLRALDASVSLDPMWGGRGDLDRLLDADHARLMQGWADRHRGAGWDVWNEASYSIYGERGRIDQLAFHHRPPLSRWPRARPGLGRPGHARPARRQDSTGASRGCATGMEGHARRRRVSGHGWHDREAPGPRAPGSLRAVRPTGPHRQRVGSGSANGNRRAARLCFVATYQPGWA